MHHIKTAISIEEALFEQLDNLARDKHVSRSKLFSLALAEYLTRQSNRDLLLQINDAYTEDLDVTERVTLQHARQQHRRIVGDEA